MSFASCRHPGAGLNVPFRTKSAPSERNATANPNCVRHRPIACIPLPGGGTPEHVLAIVPARTQHTSCKPRVGLIAPIACAVGGLRHRESLTKHDASLRHPCPVGIHRLEHRLERPAPHNDVRRGTTRSPRPFRGARTAREPGIQRQEGNRIWIRGLRFACPGMTQAKLTPVHRVA